jgi:outer membrane protein insertion porin family
MIFLKHTLCLFLFAFSLSGMAQITGDSASLPSLDYAKPKEYSIASVSVTCSEFTDKSVVRLLSGLQEGDKIQLPGDKIAEAIKSLWKQGLFEDVKIYLVKIIGKEAFINIVVVEKPRLTKFGFSNNVKKTMRMIFVENYD